MDAEKLAQLTLVETEIVRAFGDFLRGLAAEAEDEGSLLDRTSVLLTSNLGNASSHDNRNLPVVLAGGGFRHGSHLAFEHDDNTPLSNLFVSVLQRLGVEADAFG